MSSSPTCFGCFVNNPAIWNKPQQFDIPPVVFPSYEPSSKTELTDQEKYCLAELANAWNVFTQLPDKHPSDDAEFLTAIHDAQKMIALRVARRVNTEVWSQP